MQDLCDRYLENRKLKKHPWMNKWDGVERKVHRVKRWSYLKPWFREEKYRILKSRVWICGCGFSTTYITTKCIWSGNERKGRADARWGHWYKSRNTISLRLESKFLLKQDEIKKKLKSSHDVILRIKITGCLSIIIYVIIVLNGFLNCYSYHAC